MFWISKSQRNWISKSLNWECLLIGSIFTCSDFCRIWPIFELHCGKSPQNVPLPKNEEWKILCKLFYIQSFSKLALDLKSVYWIWLEILCALYFSLYNFSTKIMSQKYKNDNKIGSVAHSNWLKIRWHSHQNPSIVFQFYFIEN